MSETLLLICCILICIVLGPIAIYFVGVVVYGLVYYIYKTIKYWALLYKIKKGKIAVPLNPDSDAIKQEEEESDKN